MIAVPVKSALLVTVRSAVPSSLIAPAESRTRLLAVLVPLRSVPSPSVMSTAPAELNVSVPNTYVSSSVIDVPSKSALFVTVRSTDPSSLIAPPESRTRLSAVFVPVRSVASASVMSTAPVELNVSVPNAYVSSSVIDEPSRSALFVTVRSADPSSLIAPPEFRSRLLAVLVPLRSVPSASVMSTAPVELNVNVPNA